MARNKFDLRQLKNFKENIEQLSQSDIESMCERIVRELAARYLRDVVQLTPVGQYTDGRVGGTLRRGWTIDTRVVKVGDYYQIEVFNDVEYAKYVNNGHRTVNGGWVNGRFFVEVAAEQLEGKQRRVVEKHVTRLLRGAMHGN